MIGHAFMGQKILQIEGAFPGPWLVLPDTASVLVIPFIDLTLTALKEYLPDSIVLPLFGNGFDALDALARLADFGFSGPVAVTSPALPNPTFLMRELSAAAPGMTVTLVQPKVQAGLSRL
jgi:hypothetical protein